MENAPDCYIILKSFSSGCLAPCCKDAISGNAEAFGRHEQAIYFLLENNFNSVDRVGSF